MHEVQFLSLLSMDDCVEDKGEGDRTGYDHSTRTSRDEVVLTLQILRCGHKHSPALLSRAKPCLRQG